MGRIVGIDLGTTYSAVAVPEQLSGEGFYTVAKCPGYSVILDPQKRRITPSAVVADEAGRAAVGHSAKARAGISSPEPIFFAKRAMGTNTTFPFGRAGAIGADVVSSHILRYLKELAESRLGETVDRAVITVPAYFTLQAKQMTERAGEMAGLQVAQIAQEPVAAALAYSYRDTRDPLRIMTFDLGGGTFDIAVLQKRKGIIADDSVLAFDGDPHLGGLNFDQMLVDWLCARLGAQGYDLQLDPASRQDNVIRAKLLVYAERAKIGLSERDPYVFNEVSTGITDHRGRDVSIQLTLTRAEFLLMIAPEVERAMKLCHRALREKGDSPIDPKSIDEIIMVGGSSRIPYIAQCLEQEFGRKPRLIEPDLCVALGAAILAGTHGTMSGRLQRDYTPAETSLPDLMVTGTVTAGDDLPTADGCVVKLRALDGSYDQSRTTQAKGGFVFDGVPLAPGMATDFVLSARSPAGASVGEHRFSVAQTRQQVAVDAGSARPAGAAPRTGLVEKAITNVLSKPIGIQLVDGVFEAAPQRAPLPFVKVIRLETADVSGQIRVPILEDNTPLGAVVISDVPTTLPVGSAVELVLTIQDNYQIIGRACVAAGREYAGETIVEIQPAEVKDGDALRADFAKLKRRAQDAMRNAGRGALMEVSQDLQELLDECERLLDNRWPDCPRVQARMDEIEALVRKLLVVWRPEPPRAVFSQMCEDTAALIKQAIAVHPEVAQDGYNGRLDAIRDEGHAAYGAQNQAGWATAFERVRDLYGEVEGIIRPRESRPQPKPSELLIDLGKDLAKLAQRARDLGRYQELEGEFLAVSEALKGINPDASDAMNQIRDWYFTKFADLQEKLEPSVDRDKQGLTRLDRPNPSAILAPGRPRAGR